MPYQWKLMFLISRIKNYYNLTTLCHIFSHVPGIKEMTGTPYLACSTRRPSHHALRPALVAPYTERPGRVSSAQWLLIVMMRPVWTQRPVNSTASTAVTWKRHGYEQRDRREKSWPVLRYEPSIYMDRFRKTIKYLRQYSQFARNLHLWSINDLAVGWMLLDGS